MKALGNCKKGSLFVVSAPAGTGKTTLVQMLCDEFACVVKSVSCTTRNIRHNEVEGRDYHHLDMGDFEAKIKEGEFLEYAKVFGNYYGTSKRFVESHLNAGKHVVLVIDTQGALQLKEKVDAAFIFIRPPSIAELRRRLQGRKTESDEAAEHRLSWAEGEMKLASRYDYQIVNENLKVAYDVLRSIFIAEEHKNR
jgi:guanylate kinase